ncbi:MAG: TetR/AcrR family transcriptional regulator [Anaerolineales bacterium]|nr:TetR/AcrR family transcriptional regulator [Anaerolineales bacterium]
MEGNKKEEILKTALDLVAKRGFHGTSMAMIARSANTGAGTIYNYFESKDDLMQELYLKLKQEFSEVILKDFNPNAEIKDQFKLIWKNVIHFYLKYPEKEAFSQQFAHSPYNTDEMQEKMMTILAPVLTLVENATQNHELKEMPFSILTTFTFDVASSLAQRHSNSEIDLSPELIDMSAEICWNAISK